MQIETVTRKCLREMLINKKKNGKKLTQFHPEYGMCVRVSFSDRSDSLVATQKVVTCTFVAHILQPIHRKLRNRNSDTTFHCVVQIEPVHSELLM